MLSFFNNNKNSKVTNKTIFSPAFGEIITLEKVNDPVFASGCLGPGVAIIPSKGKLYSPLDGEIIAAYPTGHAIGIKGDNGIEVLLHVGIDTVKMNGKGFDLFVKRCQKVKRGDLILKFDVNEIMKSGYNPTVMIIVTNAQNQGKICVTRSGKVKAKDILAIFE